MYENFVCTQGSSVSIGGVLKGPDGNPVLNAYVGTEALITSIWPGGPRPALLTPATSWIVPLAATFKIEITAAETATLYAGVYEGVTRLDDGGMLPDAFYFKLTVAPGPGGIPAEPTSAAITRLVVETELIDRDAALILLCGKSVTADGNNRFLTGSIGFALQLLGITPAIPGAVSDSDLALVAPSQFYLLCDLAEYRLLKNLLANFAQPDRSAGSTKTSLNAMIERYRMQMLDHEKQYASFLGRYRSVLSTGSIRVRPASSRNEF